MAELRLCTRALKEFRDFMNELLKTIAELDEQWSMIVSFCKPKCLTHGYCNEKFSCGIRPRKEVVEKLVLEYITKGSELIE